MQKIKDVIVDAVDRAFESFRGPTTEIQLTDIALSEIAESYDTTELMRFAIEGEVKKQKRLRAIEKQADDSGDLFPETIYDRLLTCKDGDEKYVIKFRDAQIKHLLQQRDNEIENIRKIHRAFERNEKRREVLFPIMQENPGLTAAEALSIALQPA